MPDDLIQRLRDASERRALSVGEYWRLCDESLDRIEAQEAEIERIKADSERYRADRNKWRREYVKLKHPKMVRYIHDAIQGAKP